MSRNQRFVLLGLAVVVIVAAAVIIGTGGSSDVKSAGPTTIEVKDAKPVGGVKTITYKKGKTIDLTIKSDTADEAHFHCYDVHRPARSPPPATTCTGRSRRAAASTSRCRRASTASSSSSSRSTSRRWPT